MMFSIEELGVRLDALKLWQKVTPYNWAIKPLGTVFPYFCTFLTGDKPPVKVRLLLLEGWQTFHDYVRTRLDHNYAFYSSPSEFAHFELIILESGEVKLFRYDPGYVPLEATPTQRALCARILWEVYGVMMRIESDDKLPVKFADQKAMFARLENKEGWTDSPLVIPDPLPHVEKVSFAKTEIAKAKDLPMDSNFKLALDFRLLTNIYTKEPRPRAVYLLIAIDDSTGERLIYDKASIVPESGLRGLWEGLAPQLLKRLIEFGRIPSEIKVLNGRVFRMIRPLCMELPFKLSLHDSLPNIEKSMI